MTRWKAASIHLLISVVLISLIAFGLISLWYGWELFSVMGGLRLLIIMAICDVTIGPLLTLIVYKKGKPSLKFDLTVIALFQIAFMAYGLNMMAQSRPVFIVGNADRFDLVFANDIADEDLAKAPSQFSRRSWTGPIVVGGDLGKTSKEQIDIALSGFAGKDVPQMPQRYVPYEEVAPTLLTHSVPAALFAARSAQHGAAVDRGVGRSGRDENELAILPIMSKRGSAAMLIDAKTGAVVGPIAADPWNQAENVPPKGTN